MSSDGTNQRRVTNDGLSRWPSWTNDGRLLYTRNGAIYISDGDGKNPSMLIAGTNYQPSQSPDGRHLLFSREDFVGKPQQALSPDATSVDISLIAPRLANPEVSASAPPELVAIGRCVLQRRELLVWLPGTRGAVTPDSPIPNLAASHCIHVIGINYDTATDAIDECRFDADASACYEAFRLEKLDGLDRTVKLAIAPQDSLEGRLKSLLQYLSVQRPGEGWSEYLSDGEVRLDLVIIAGVSQGAGQAAAVARVHTVKRVIMLAAWAEVIGGDDGPLSAWLSLPGATPPDRYFALAHMRDGKKGRSHLGRVWSALSPADEPKPNFQRVWTALGLDQFGPVADIDKERPPYGGSHKLMTNLDCPVGEEHCFHTVVNRPELAPALTPAWEYLLGLR
jgi:hypothetical protein